jgi:hypothetical protein
MEVFKIKIDFEKPGSGSRHVPESKGFKSTFFLLLYNNTPSKAIVNAALISHTGR